MIGIFDSGAGGLTTLKAIRELLPKYDLVYFGDTARFPYGSQSPERLRQYAEEDADFLLSRGARLIVIACNSVSAVAADHLCERLKVPVFDVVQPAVEAAQRITRGRIGVIGTRATVGSGVYERLLQAVDKNILVISRATPMLVPLVEERWWKYPESMRIIRRSLKPLKDAHVDTLILACTHYPFLQALIARVMGKTVKIVNPAESTAASVKNFLEQNPAIDAGLSKNSRSLFYVSSDPRHFQETAKWWLGERVEASEAVNPVREFA
ncbi:glutamate racemase [Candidatus Uhrbacteria bacterium RIFCSPLOWO2_12_FULL_46_10]|uniref:Glutamate racemase n=1 Tax=Candidatus Uhrbacteria bacterium RIFCSPLOWO2_01_FULL_47_25 TaxID=1802402 RepID=A0A1F7UXS6_9BACT|nr:MAG: Glutamate racemase [Parcubacteria group bacterium GW2011_GWA2_46_9]OGL61198.1 MAG: glutamate racemase [Candidatus Uhrbacteria bacterium RIFCSPHIGHO2_01_FULL_46_23]OGL70569.1 MAG: glutamate racemase [Candidatus Uhrbacteria bacterium RIFCSPHIGHO2_02_FULL_47_29]OGL74896.1 MAG: glutamate racemase [Candidatus Uhrbacteria bacterium RIFCSPHIGHO2_12_FULL_46_13]OGL83102.1 MAG: glutamate racemase [Candidatus Uhrbacteria bacterium RIFCSPLOWO2_01_FULL_47_25]OGL84494.1 MAG: glutamate racemase [Cand